MMSNRERSSVLLGAMLVLQPELVLPGVEAVRRQDVQGGDVAVGVAAWPGETKVTGLTKVALVKLLFKGRHTKLIQKN